MKRNSIFAASTLLLAGAVVGAGAMISGSAMADSGNSPNSADVTIGIANGDGEVMECSISGADADAFFGLLERGIAPEGIHSISGVATVGTVTPEEAEAAAVDVSEMLPADGPNVVIGSDEEVIFGDAVVGSRVSAVGEGEIDPATQAEAIEILDDYEVRVGSDDECAAVLDHAGSNPSAKPESKTGE